jgi:hypothetical protein
MNYQERLEISQKLQSYHYFFRAFWDIGNPTVGKFDNLHTAAITFDEQGNHLNLLINEDFWNFLNEDTKLFLICHEILHILLEHGHRFSEYMGTPEFSNMNIAADVVINETLITSFGFNKFDLNNELGENGCWLSTVFKDDKKCLPNQSTEYYFNRLPKDIENKYFAIDSHRVLTPEQHQQMQDVIDASGVMDKIDESFTKKLPSNTETTKLKQSAAGKGSGSWLNIHAVTKKKYKWETVIKKWESQFIRDDINTQERWERVTPRYSQLISDTISLPTENWILNDFKDKHKIDVWFFLDTSGSCIGLKDRFFTAARSLNTDRFNIRLFCFDTSVVEIDIKQNKVYGGGGTSFGIIETKIQNIIKSENVKYPKAVWLITDGYGVTVNPEKPGRWYWFLSNDYRHYIPTESKIFKLSDFE